MSHRRRSDGHHTVRDATYGALHALNPWADMYNVAAQEPQRRRQPAADRRCESHRSTHDHRHRSDSKESSHRRQESTAAPAASESRRHGKSSSSSAPRAPKRPAFHRPNEARREISGYAEGPQAVKAEERALRRADVQGQDLETLRRKYHQKMKFEAFVQNDQHAVGYDIAGHTYYATARPQAAGQDIAARYHVAKQHEARMARRNIDDPWSEDAAHLMHTPVNRVGAVPREDFDKMFYTCRQANQDCCERPAHFFDIPTTLGGDMFKVDLNRNSSAKGAKKKALKKTTEKSGLSKFFRRMSMF